MIAERAGGRRLMRRLVWAALAIEGFLLALGIVAPLGGVTLSISPLAKAWPWLLAPSRAIFGDALVNGSTPGARGWPELALVAVLLVGASCAAGQAVWLAHRSSPSGATNTTSETGPTAPPEAIAARRRWLWLALGSALIMGSTLVVLPALPSDDVFSYILYGRISVIHHANPLVATPANFPSDPFLSLVFWRDTRSVYGPVWLLISSGIALLAQALGGSLVVYVALFKLLGLLAHLANAALIWLILGRIAPRRQLVGVLFYAWNPLCLVEFCASGHNDAVMLTLLLLGVYFLARRWEAAALVAIGLSIATKYVPLALFPMYLLAVALPLWARLRAQGAGRWEMLWRIGLGLAWRIGVVALTMIMTALPYWAGSQTLSALLYSPPAQQLDNSLLEAISWPLRWLAQGLGLSRAQAATVVETALKLGALVAFAALWLWSFRYVVIGARIQRIRRMRKAKGKQSAAAGQARETRETVNARWLTGIALAWGWALLWYELVASGWFWPWYVTWAVALAALAPWGRLSIATLLLAGGALTLYAFLPLQSSPVYGYRAFLAFGSVWVYLIWNVWRRRSEWRTAITAIQAVPVQLARLRQQGAWRYISK